MAILAQDSFNRADNATTLGSSDTGQTYTYMNSSVWGISANQAYCISGSNPMGALLDVGQSDIAITVKVAKVNDNFACFLRVDPVAKTGIAFQAATGALQRFSGSTFINIATSSVGATGDIIKIVAQGSSLTVYRNGTQIISTTSTINQTLTKHGIGNWRGGGTGNGLWDDLLIEDLGGGTPTGTPGSTLFNLKQSLYLTSALNYDLKQALYQALSQSFDSRQAVYQNNALNFDSKQVLFNQSSSQNDTKQQLFNVSATQYDTRQTIYQIASTLYDTLQQIADGSIIGSTRFDTRMVLYSADKAVYDTKQSIYQTGANNYDLKQAIYQAGQLQGDIKIVLYANASTKADMLQRIYSDGLSEFDMLQSIFNPDKQIIGTIQLKGQRVLNIILKGQREINVLLKGQRVQNVILKGSVGVTAKNQNFTTTAGDSFQPVFLCSELKYNPASKKIEEVPVNFAGCTLKWVLKKSVESAENLVSKTLDTGITIQEDTILIQLDKADTDNLGNAYPYYHECEMTDQQGHPSTLFTGRATIEISGV
jgi:hypothetical protein